MQKLNKINILLSYAYIKDDLLKIIRDNKNIIRLLIDSGAFTAFTKEKKINIDEYCDFLKENQDIIWKYFTLDEIGNEEKTLENYKYMLNKGLNPIPIFTAGQNPKDLEFYYKYNDVVGLGGLIGLPKSKKGYLKYIINNFIRGRKVHLLGCTDEATLRTFKPYMCDSSSITSNVRYGDVLLNLKNFCLYIIDYKKFKKNKKWIIKKKIIDLIGRKEYNNLRKKEHWKGDTINKAYVKLGFLSWYDIMINAKKLFNIKLFLVFTSINNLSVFMKIIKNKHYNNENSFNKL